MKSINRVRGLAGALVVVLPLWLGSCQKNGDGAVTPKGIEGTWQIAGLKINPALDLFGQKTNDLLTVVRVVSGEDAVACVTSTRITFNPNGKITGQPGAKCTSANNEYVPVEDASTWQLNGSKLTITAGTDVTVYDVTINGNTLLMNTQDTDDLDGDGKTETYTYTTELTRI